MYVKQDDGTYLCRGGVASYFGDQEDVDTGQDNGVSAFGFSYVKHPSLMGVALPTQRGKSLLPNNQRGELYGIRKLLVPYDGTNWDKATKVRVYSRETKKTAIGVYADVGPSNFTHRPVDLLPAMAKALGLPPNSLYTVDVRVLTPKK